MKITIEAEEHTAFVEFKQYDLTEFSHYLRGILHTIWYPSQVDSIMPTEEILSNELAEARQVGYAEGFDAGLENSKDSARLDWLQSSGLTLHSLEEGDVWARAGVYAIREYIDKQLRQSGGVLPAQTEKQ